jgi:hypothetical protein
LTRSFLPDGVECEADEIVPTRVMFPESTAAWFSKREELPLGEVPDYLNLGERVKVAEATRS